MLNNKGFDLWAEGYDKAVGLSCEEKSYPFRLQRCVGTDISESIAQGKGSSS